MEAAISARALLRSIEFLHYRARAAGDDGARRRRTAHQRGDDRAFGLVEGVGCVTEKAKRRSADAHQLTAQWHQIQIRLDDLLLRPAMLERNRVAKLHELFFKRAAAESIAFSHQAGELHRDRARTAPTSIAKLIHQCREAARRIEAEVPPEAVIFCGHDGAYQRRRHRVERGPFELTARHVDAQALQRLTVARQQRRFGAERAGAKLVKARRRCQRRDQR